MITDNFYKRLLDNANDLIWAIDMEGQCTYINDNITSWGYSKEELIGRPLLSILDSKYTGKRYSRTSKLGIRSTHEMEVLDKMGQSHHITVSSSPLHDEDGKIIGLMGIIREIAEIQKLSERLKNEERLASLGRLATGIAHEIRNPLSSVKMNLAILKQKLQPVTDDREHFELAQAEVANLERIVTELVDYAKPIPLKLRRVDLRKTVVESAMKMSQAACNEYGVSFTTDFTKSIPLVRIDEGKMRQALLNVLLNAIHCSKPGDQVCIEIRHVDGYSPAARIVVKDQGSGIKPEDLKSVYDPFFTTKQSGTGLGLSIVKNILNNHNGTIYIESEPDEGTRVCLEFPVG